MAVTVYRSTDTGAPALYTDSAGSLITILDACLVNGYGSQPAAGWTKAFTGTNKAAYRMSTTAPASGFYLRIDDTSTTESRWIGYESMTDVDTGVDPFPLDAQVTGGMYTLKIATSSEWVLIADDRAFYFFHHNPSLSLNAAGTFFGDIVSNVAADAYSCAMAGRYSGTFSGAFEALANLNTNISSTTGHYISRNYDGTVKSVNSSPIGKLHGSYVGSSGFDYPNLADNNLVMDRVILADSSSIKNYRGYYPGLWNPLHQNPGNHNDTFSGTGALAGKTFLILDTYQGRSIIETSDTWRS